MAFYLTKQDSDALIRGFREAFGTMPERFFSAPGRTEIGGNHTDHQRGRVLAAAVNLDSRAAVRANGTDTIRILSEGYPLCQISLSELTPSPREVNTTAALIRGIAARFAELGHPVAGFDAYCTSTVLPGSGLSSSAAFEVLIGTIMNHLFCDGAISPARIAMIGQYAENVFFGKPSGLMDQMASSVGNLVAIDFLDRDNPRVDPLDFDFSRSGHALCIIDSRASHADLTGQYAAIPEEMKSVCAFFGKEVLSEVDEADFYRNLAALRTACGDRAVLRAIHFYQENARVPLQVQALQNGNFPEFLRLVRESGRSSYMYLQNVLPEGDSRSQAMGIALALCEKYLEGTGAFRVHGGGFAGTVQAFVPTEKLDSFCRGIHSVLGDGACHVLSIRPEGGVEAFVQE